MSNIQFAPEPPFARQSRVSTSHSTTGVVAVRTPSAARAPSVPPTTWSDDSNEPGLLKEGDIHHKQHYKGWTLAWLSYQSIGVIYGDIGTSPLYVYSSTFSSNPSYDDLLGALSLIIYSLTIMVTLKYICIVLLADDEGEGGTFALYSLLSRYANISKRDPKELSMIEFKRHDTNMMRKSTNKLRNFLESHRSTKIMLKCLGVLGVAMIMADGVLTPAQSVLGSIQGLTVINPNLSIGTIIGVTCAILVCLFLIQPLGTTKLASTFAPIVIIWLSFNFGFGVYNLVWYDHSVLKAFSPWFAGNYLVRNGYDGWTSLGGILLAFTGVEALFADLGAFSAPAIRLSWLCFVYPCLLMAYIGQAAFISVNPEAYANPFYNCVPPGMFYPSLVVAILATIVASQALITSTFQLLAQVMKLSYFPQIKVVHVSKIFHGQIYIPLANWLLMIGTVIVTAVYNNTTSLGNAYGVCVIFVTFITTCMVSLVALIIWRIHPLIVLVGFLIFGSFDGVFLSSSLVKIPQGAWFTLLLAFILSSIFILWRFGKEQQWAAEASDRFPPSQLVHTKEDGTLQLSPAHGSAELTLLKGFAIFFDKAGEMTPTVFLHFVQKFVAAPRVMVYFHLRPLQRPTIPPEERYTVIPTGIPNCYRLVIRHGYTDVVLTNDIAFLVYQQVQAYIIAEGAGTRTRALSTDGETTQARIVDLNPDAPSNQIATTDLPRSSTEKPQPHTTTIKIDDPHSTSEGLRSRAGPSVTTSPVQSTGQLLKNLETAYGEQVLYIVGKEQMRISPGTNIFRRIILSTFLFIRENTRSKMAAMKIPMDQLVEIGFVKDV